MIRLGKHFLEQTRIFNGYPQVVAFPPNIYRLPFWRLIAMCDIDRAPLTPPPPYQGQRLLAAHCNATLASAKPFIRPRLSGFRSGAPALSMASGSFRFSASFEVGINVIINDAARAFIYRRSQIRGGFPSTFRFIRGNVLLDQFEMIWLVLARKFATGKQSVEMITKRVVEKTRTGKEQVKNGQALTY